MELKPIAEKAFEYYLIQSGKSASTKTGTKSTVNDYSGRVKKICNREGFSNLDELALHINDIIQKYDTDTEETVNSNDKSALKNFREFLMVIN